MLDKVSIKDFKCHSNTLINLKNLTLLVGTNSSGKSSVIQSLLLVIHHITDSVASPLNGHLVSIGNFSEARNIINNAKSFELGINLGSEELKLKYTSPDGKQETSEVEILSQSEKLEEFLNYFNKHIYYLSANRIGGQDLYSRNFDNYDVYGLNGEYAIDYFQINKSNTVDKELLFSKDSETLEAQVNYWLDLIFNHTISTSSILNTDKVQAEYSLTSGKYIRPKNIGSGVSFVISILIVCLSSKKEDVVIIENPEIHLHPKAQSLLTEFFVAIAISGRQLIIETHSDHVFNGVRVFVNDKKIDKEKVSINFFTLDNESHLSDHTLVELNEEGRVVNNKTLLFDQFNNDINSLLGI